MNGKRLLKPSSAWKLAFPSGTKRAAALILGSAGPRKSRVFARHDGTAGDVWSADLR
jgi:hypothetical protein